MSTPSVSDVHNPPSAEVVELILAQQLHYKVDYNNAARVVVSTALGQVPFVGFALSALTNIFWPPSRKDIWSEIKEKVEKLIDEKLDQLVFQQVQESLEGLHSNLNEYVWAVQHSKDTQYITQKFNIAHGHFIQELPRFQSRGYQLLLLPLFAHYANLHLTLLRDGVLFGKDWGWSDVILKRILEQMSQAIQVYSQYADKIYVNGLKEVEKSAPKNKHYTEPFNTINRYKREMTLTVLDFKNMWPYFDAGKYPEPVQVYLNREIYSDAVGTADNSGTIKLPPPPTKRITAIEVWAWDRIDGCQLTYEEGGGPNGVTKTARMGNKNGGSSGPPHGGVFDLKKRGPITAVKSRSGEILNAWWFTFKDGSTSQKLGGNYRGGKDTVFSYEDHIVSSIKIMGVSRFYGSADCAVFGFKFEQETKVTDPDLLRLMYVTSPEELKPEKLAYLSGAENNVEATKQLQEWIDLYHWKILRQRHWEQVRNTVESNATHDG